MATSANTASRKVWTVKRIPVQNCCLWDPPGESRNEVENFTEDEAAKK